MLGLLFVMTLDANNVLFLLRTRFTLLLAENDMDRVGFAESTEGGSCNEPFFLNDNLFNTCFGGVGEAVSTVCSDLIG